MIYEKMLVLWHEIYNQLQETVNLSAYLDLIRAIFLTERSESCIFKSASSHKFQEPSSKTRRTNVYNTCINMSPEMQNQFIPPFTTEILLLEHVVVEIYHANEKRLTYVKLEGFPSKMT